MFKPPSSPGSCGDRQGIGRAERVKRDQFLLIKIYKSLRNGSSFTQRRKRETHRLAERDRHLSHTASTFHFCSMNETLSFRKYTRSFDEIYTRVYVNEVHNA